MIQDKKKTAVNGYSPNKGCDAVLDYLLASLRAQREAAIRGVAFLEKGLPFPSKRALRLTVSHCAENVKYRWVLHWEIYYAQT